MDGPSGAGKSTLARLLAQIPGIPLRRHGRHLPHPGAVAADRNGGSTRPTAAAVIALLARAVHRPAPCGTDGLQHMYLDGEDVSRGDPPAGGLPVAPPGCRPFPQVRAFLMDMQRELARRQDVIMDGRDIGTVVLPQADVKIFLTATPEDRARRRCAELKPAG